MGLSSSQARLLNLTTRMHQIEYKAAKIEAEKLQMANESDRVYQTYLDALEMTKVQRKKLASDGSVTYVDMAGYSDFTGAGFALATATNTYAPGANGEGYYQAGADATSVVIAEKKTNGETPIEGAEGGTIAANAVYYEVGSTKYASLNAFNAVYTPASAENLWNALTSAIGVQSPVDANFEKVLTNVINTGEVIIVTKNNDGVWVQPGDPTFADTQTSVATNTNLQEVQDESVLRKAEAQYEADMKKIDRKERKFDSDLASLDNERNAIKQEMDTLKTVAKDNVERTFKLFS